MILHIDKRIIDPEGRECTVVDCDGLTVNLDYRNDKSEPHDYDVVLRDEIDERWGEKIP